MIPKSVEAVISALKKNGHEAYLVGGCVRDMLLGSEPFDYDVTTSALPEETKRALSGFKVIETGIAHGTVTAVSDGKSVEITTYRADGEYTDHRRPDSVSFTKSLREDLSRRDFTVNAIAFDGCEIVDPFGGREDLEKRMIRAVGDPEKRFDEDALRILRALRFASKLGFEIESGTKAAIRKKYHLLSCVSSERVYSELCGILLGDNVCSVLLEFPEVICHIIPELRESVGCDQMTPYHIYDVYGHTARVVANARKDKILRLAALLHDVAKPKMKTVDSRGRGHFKGHAPEGAKTAETVLKRLRAESETVKRVCELIALHDERPEANERSVLRYMAKYSYADLDRLTELRRADNLAKNPDHKGENDDIDRFEEVYRKLLLEGAPYKVSQLRINGGEIAELGADGREIGETLSHLLSLAVEGRVENENNALKSAAKSYIQAKK